MRAINRCYNSLSKQPHGKNYTSDSYRELVRLPNAENAIGWQSLIELKKASLVVKLSLKNQNC